MTILNLKFLFTTLLIISFHSAHAQFNYTFEGLTFETPIELNEWNNKEPTFDRHNDYFDIYIDMLKNDEYPSSDLAMQACFAAIDLEDLHSLVIKDKINDFENSYHLVGYDVYDVGRLPVIVGVILDSKNKIGYEIFILCEGISEEDGLKILNTFKYIKK